MKNYSPIQVTPVILCGGSGTRLWPLSRTGFPKQFLVLSGKTSLFQQAVERVNGLASEDIKINDSLIVTNEEHRFLVLDQLRELTKVAASILLEPAGRNTAPALTLAALQASAAGDDPVLVVTPSDQTINDNQSYRQALQNAIRVAASGAIVVLGVAPEKPETGFGYIKHEGEMGQNGEYQVVQFAEKPDLKSAEAYLASGQYSWNSGMFVVRASVWLNALKKFRKDIFDATLKSFEKSVLDHLFIRPDGQLFADIPSESIDYAVMEKSIDSKTQVRMVMLDAGWNDLGSWDAVWQVGVRDCKENVIHGDVVLEDTTNTLLYSTHRLIAAVGVSNLVIVETADAILVADRGVSQHVKKVVSKLEAMEREERVLHRKVSRPWGWYDTIDIGSRFKVKRIQVNPGASLSLQKHTRRAEHWVVVKGEAEVTCGQKVIRLKENESTFIPQGEMHRLVNTGNEVLEIIEVQSGEYLSEDDIIRLGDLYGRIV